MWRSKEALPEDLIFWVSYLGGEEATMAINFSRSASQIIGQYYVFMRNGFEGYKEIQKRTLDVAHHLVDEIKKIGIFIMYEEASEVPSCAGALTPRPARSGRCTTWTTVCACMAGRSRLTRCPRTCRTSPASVSWPAPDLSMTMADKFIKDMKAEIKNLDNATVIGSADTNIAPKKSFPPQRQVTNGSE